MRGVPAFITETWKTQLFKIKYKTYLKIKQKSHFKNYLQDASPKNFKTANP